MENESQKKRRLRIGLLLVGFWMLFGLLYGGMHYVGAVITGATAQFHPIWSVLAWSSWIPTTLLTVWFARRLMVTRGNWYFTVPAHLLGAMICSLFAAGLYTGMRAIEAFLSSATGFSYLPYLRNVLGGSLAIDSTLYLTIVVGVYAFEYYRRYRERTLQAQQLETDLVEAQLHALGLQLQPHFLFNSFHTIAMLVRQHEEERATETIANLSDFLRYVLEGEGAQEVPCSRKLISCAVT